MGWNGPGPAPGSDRALNDGCACPVLDNSRGRGWMGGVEDEHGNTLYWINADCPIHGHLHEDDDVPGGEEAPVVAP